MDEKAIDVTSWGAKVATGVCVPLRGDGFGSLDRCVGGWLVGWMGVQLVRRSNGSYAKMAHEVTASCGVTKSFGFGQAGNSFELPSCVCLMRIL